VGEKIMETTLIGSVPNDENIEKIIDDIFTSVTIPCWPQIPKRSFKEHMCSQYSENFPGIVVDGQQQKIFLDEKKFELELERFYQNFVDKNLDYYKISSDYAYGFYKFIEQIKQRKLHKVKLQTIGPLTFGLTVKTKDGKAIFYNEQYREVVINLLIMKTLWQIKVVKETISDKINIIVFYDEPYLAAYGSAFTAVSKEEIIQTLSKLVSDTKNFVNEIFNNTVIKIGIHCCANTDWSILTSVEDLDIISFDSYEFFDNFVLYSEEIKKFLDKKDKYIAWGIIPNTEKVFNETKESLDSKFKEYVSKLVVKGIEENQLKNCIITPQCGLGSANYKVFYQVLQLCKEFTNFSTNN
jgi:methionine synthase II (cobalamin-independent)